MTIKILLFLYLKQLFSSFPPENIANCEIVKDDLTDIYNIFSCNGKKIKERDKEITTIKKNKENITIVYLYYQLIHEKSLYFAAVVYQIFNIKFVFAHEIKKSISLSISSSILSI